MSKLYYAAKNDDLEEVKRLVEAGENVNYLHKEAKLSKLTASGIGIPVCIKGTTPLIIASAYGNTEVVRYLLSKGADVHYVDRKGTTALYRAVRYDGDEELVQLLVDAGANIHAKYFYSKINLLHTAAANGYVPVINLLIKLGLDPNITIKYNQHTPLIAAVREWNLDAIDALIAAGANIDHQDVNGQTAFHYAVMETGFCGPNNKPNLRLLKHFLKYKPRNDILDKEGRPATQYRYYHENVIQLLEKEHGYKIVWY